MDGLNPTFRDALQAIVDGQADQRDEAWHELVEAGPAALTDIVRAYHATGDRRAKIALLTVVNEYRTAEAADFLQIALKSPDEQIWKTALDGLVSLGDETAHQVLTRELGSATSTKRDWIQEAVTQIKSSS